MKPIAIVVGLAALLAAAGCAPVTDRSSTMVSIEDGTTNWDGSLPIRTQYGHDPVYPNYGGR